MHESQPNRMEIPQCVREIGMPIDWIVTQAEPVLKSRPDIELENQVGDL